MAPSPLQSPSRSSSPISQANIPLSPQIPESFRHVLIPDRHSLNNIKEPMTCHICLRMAHRKPSWRQHGLAKTCLLYNNEFCPLHKGKEGGVCEINHQTYYRKAKHHILHAPRIIYPSLEVRACKMGLEEEGEEMLGGDEAGETLWMFEEDVLIVK